ncbi:hypothetical protein KIPB_011418, partial [Kipferlia bialata]
QSLCPVTMSGLYHWFSHCTSWPSITKSGGHSLTAVCIGQNTVMAVYFTSNRGRGRERLPPQLVWSIVTLSEENIPQTETVTGPTIPGTVESVYLERVGGYVVAYTCHADVPNSTWHMHTYCIDTGEWEELFYEDGCIPEPRVRPLVFQVGQSLILTGGYGVSDLRRYKDTWEWSQDTRLWTQVDDCPHTLDRFSCGAGTDGVYHTFGTDTPHHSQYHPVNSGAIGNATVSRWSTEPDPTDIATRCLGTVQPADFDQFDDEEIYQATAISLSNTHQLHVVQTGFDDCCEVGVPTCWIRDCISLDTVRVASVPGLVDVTHDDQYTNDISGMAMLMINQDTLLVMSPRVTLVVEVCHDVLSPEF